MNLKKKLGAFFTLTRKSGDGFTLVELIVVIAVLAILGGVAVPAYSGYVEKANMGVDQQLVSEVRRALELGYYAGNYEDDVFVSIGLSADDLDYGGNAGVAQSLSDVFGEGFENQLVLKYDGWSAKFQDSGFYGEDGAGLNELLGTVDTLTGALGDALTIPGLGGDGFNAYMEKMGATTEVEKSNAAVFYVADSVSKMGYDKLQEIKSIVGSGGSTKQEQLENFRAMNTITGSALVTTATLYAIAEGYARYYDEQEPETAGQAGTPGAILRTATNTLTAQATDPNFEPVTAYYTLMTAFGQMKAVNDETSADYFLDGMDQDLKAYEDVLKTVSSSKDAIVGQVADGLANPEFFGASSPVKDLLSQYADGGVFVYAIVNEDGTVTFSDSISAAE